MGCRTKQNTITSLIGTVPYPILGSSPRRKAFLLSPVASGGGGGGSLLAVVFSPGSDQPWTVPNGLTTIQNIFLWGGGGNSGVSQSGLGGGGGGGGAFAASGPLPCLPGSVWMINVGTAGGSGGSEVLNSLAIDVLACNAGGNGVNDAAGAGGIATVGATQITGGSGAAATLLGGVGGGGGGGAGAYSSGQTATTLAGGAGGGAAQILGYGAGGAGGAGDYFVGSGGTAPGGGGGGGGNQDGTSFSPGSGGLAVIFYETPTSQSGPISLSHRSDVAPGVGILNYLPGATFPTLISDDDIGQIITEEWWIVSGVDGVLVQITEYLYEDWD